MKRCDQYRDRFAAYLYGELPSAEDLEILEHLSGCDACTEAVERLRNWMEKIRQGFRVEAPSEFWNTYRRRLRGRLAEKWERKRFSWRPALLVPVALVLSAGALFLLREQFDSPRRFSESRRQETVPGEILDVALNLEVLEQLSMLERMDELEETPGPSEGERRTDPR